MSAQSRKFIYAALSFLLFPFGFYLYFKLRPKRDAQLYGILGLLGIVFIGFFIN